MLGCVGLSDDISYRFSQWDPHDRDKYIGTEEQWNEAQGMMYNILDHLGIKYSIGVGEAAFYGPKLIFKLKTSTAKRTPSSQSRLTRCLPHNSEWNMSIKTEAKKLRVLSTEPPSDAMSVLLPLFSKNLPVRFLHG